MTTGSDADTLRRITQTLLDPTSEFGALRDATIDAHALLSRICEMDTDDPHVEDSRETLLPTGKAISPLDAGRCLLDFARTTKFLRGVRAAIDQTQSRFPGETIHVLYAGCGPFAPLVLPLATVLKPRQAQFTFLDIHPRSLQCVKRIVEALELSPFVRRCVPCDATVYDHGDEPPIHVLVIECMQKALDKEPQVAIAMNLVPQMCEGGILIPERILLTAALADIGAEVVGRRIEGAGPEVLLDASEVRKQRVILGAAFELSAESARAFGSMSCRDGPEKRCQDEFPVDSSSIKTGTGQETLPDTFFFDGAIALPAGTLQNRPPSYEGQQLVILTNITVFDSIVLGDYESGLTYPTPMPIPDPTAAPESLSFAYRLGTTPGLVYRGGTV